MKNNLTWIKSYPKTGVYYIEKSKNQPISVKISLIVMGFLVFSPFSSILVMDMLGFPMSLPELLFLPFLIIFRKRYYFSPFGSIRDIIFFSLWIIMIIISVLADNYSIVAILSSSRSYLTLVIAYLLFSKKNNVMLDDVMYISLGATLGWLYSSIYGINIYLLGYADVVSRCGNLLSIPLLISIAVFRKHNKILILSIILCIAISLTSGMRRQIVVFLMSVFLAYGFLFLRNIKQFFTKLFTLGLPVIIFVVFLPQIKDYVESNIPDLNYRVFSKTEMFLSSVNYASGDEARLNSISDMTNNFSDYIVPKGFVSRRMIEDSGGAFIDFPLSELLYMFGAFLTVLLLSFFIIQTIRCYYQSSITNNDSMIFVVLSIIMFMLLFLEGTFLSSSYVAPVTGYCLGRLKYYSKLSFVIR